MTTALLAEPRISLVDLAEREGVHFSTVSRWCSEGGFKGHRLESFNIGGKKFTTIPAYQRWLQAINGEVTDA
jgi:hypothetical protein